MQNSTHKCSKVLVTGANGFIGKALCSTLNDSGYSVIQVIRQISVSEYTFGVGEIHSSTDWSAPLKSNPDCVIHLAACIQPSNKSIQASLFEARQVNTGGTLNLARQSAAAGIKRFIFLSTVKVFGEGQDTPYQADDIPSPVDAYAISKWEAEQGLWRIARETGMEVVILRPVLVYGPGVKGNFLSLIKAVDKGIPLPLGSIRNCRSLLYIGNLVDVIELCMSSPEVPGKCFTLSDGEDLSTPDLVRHIGAVMHRPVRLLPVPVSIIRFMGRLLSKEAQVNRLLGSLSIDTKLINDVLHWSPPYSFRDGLKKTIKCYREEEQL